MTDTYLITGVSRGIGRALAEAALARGGRVIGTVRRPGDAPAGIEEHRLDVADPAAYAPLSAALGDTAIDVLVCNAGVYRGRGGLDGGDAEAAAWEDSVRINVAAPFWAVRALLPHLARAVRPRIAIISSQMGSSARARGGSYIYRATKAGAINLAVNLALDLRPKGIAVGVYHPGWVQTDMGGGGADITVAQSAAGLLARLEALTLDRTGVYEDYAGAPIPF